MAHRIFDAKIIKADSDNNRLVVQRRRMDIAGTAKNSRIVFNVDSYAIITNKDSSFLMKMCDLRPGDRVNIDFVKMKDIVGAEDKSLLVKGINVME
jgi:hypothetical protein